MAKQKVALYATSGAELRQALLFPLPPPALENAEPAVDRLLAARPRLQPIATQGAFEARPKLRGVLHAVAFVFSCFVGALVIAYTPNKHELAAAVFAISASMMLVPAPSITASLGVPAAGSGCGEPTTRASSF